MKYASLLLRQFHWVKMIRMKNVREDEVGNFEDGKERKKVRV